MVDVLMTTAAAAAVRAMLPAARAAVARFVSTGLPDYVEHHEPIEIRGLRSKYWVVAPPGADQVALLVTTAEGQEEADQLVVTAVVPKEFELLDPAADRPMSAAIGADVLRSVQTVT